MTRLRLLLLPWVALFLTHAFANDLDQPPRPISPVLVGTNLWYGMPADAVWRQTREAKIRLIRIGGHAYDQKPPSADTLVEWVKKIRSIGAEPILQVSQYQSAEQAAETVALFNRRRAAGAPVQFWTIGNEPWLQNGQPADLTKIAERVAGYFKPTAAAMKLVDPSIKIYGPNESYLIPELYASLFGGAHDITGRVPEKGYYYIDGLTWHRYPQTENEPGLAEIQGFQDSMRRSREWVDAVNARHQRVGEQALQWGIGEFNAKGGPQVHTFGNGQMFGAVYGFAMVYGASFAKSWSMYESRGSRETTDFGAYDGTEFVPRASYWHQRLFAETFTGVTVPQAVSSREDILFFASADAPAGRLGVMILNLSEQDHDYQIRFNAGPSNDNVLILTLPFGRSETYKDHLPGRTSQFLVFENQLVRKTSYSASDFAGSKPPTTTSVRTTLRLR